MNRKLCVFLAVAFAVLASIFLTETGTSAQNQTTTPRLVQAGASQPLRNMKPVLPRDGHRVIPFYATPHQPSSGQTDPVVQSSVTATLATSPGLNFAGVGQGDYGYNVAVAPPDTNGDAGDTQ